MLGGPVGETIIFCEAFMGLQDKESQSLQGLLYKKQGGKQQTVKKDMSELKEESIPT